MHAVRVYGDLHGLPVTDGGSLRGNVVRIIVFQVIRVVRGGRVVVCARHALQSYMNHSLCTGFIARGRLSCCQEGLACLGEPSRRCGGLSFLIHSLIHRADRNCPTQMDTTESGVEHRLLSSWNSD